MSLAIDLLTLLLISFTLFGGVFRGYVDETWVLEMVEESFDLGVLVLIWMG